MRNAVIWGMAYDSQMKHPRLRETVLAWDDIAAAPRFFRDYEGRQITLPRRFLPDQDLLEYHRTNVFRG